MSYLVLDFGGSAVKCAVMTEKAEILEQFSVPSQVGSYETWLDAFEPYFHRCNDEFDVRGIAISTCGAVDVDTGFIHGSSALPYIHGFDVKSLFESKFGVPTEIENDACCASLAESWLGAGKDSDHFSLLVIGTGIGGAVVTNQQVMKGHNLHGGEFGFTILEYQNEKPVIFGHLASTQSLVNMAADALNVPKDSLNGIQVFELFDAQDTIIKKVVDKWLGYLATGIINIQYSVDPELIIIGGAISRRHDLIELIKRKISEILTSVPEARIVPNVKTSEFGNDANLIGALKHYLNRQGYNNE
ncbi:ROK family protein [Vibrio maerlii]|uniref:ROK family protein n=1 Tax=Vibrio maerlii TaxID=2231648 RepID=UPI000E3BA1BE|nr:ROK family protein [Vibrio maerlii]